MAAALRNAMETKLVKHYFLGDTLGVGAYGEVIKAKKKFDNQDYAIKLIRLSPHSDTSFSLGEVCLLAKLSHPNVIRYYNAEIYEDEVSLELYEALEGSSEGKVHCLKKIVFPSKATFIASLVGPFNSPSSVSRPITITSATHWTLGDGGSDGKANDSEDSIVFKSEDHTVLSDGTNGGTEENSNNNEPLKIIKCLVIQMELCHKSLRNIIDNEELFRNDLLIFKYFMEICKGLSYIHHEGVIHRDLNPLNILVDHNDVIKIVDFGLSRPYIDMEIQENGQTLNDVSPKLDLTPDCGTNFYMAPEIMSSQNEKQKKILYDNRVDIYSLGVIFMEMCLPSMTNMEKSKLLPITDEILQHVNFRTRGRDKHAIVKRLLNPNYEARPSCDLLLQELKTDVLSRFDFKNHIKRFSRPHPNTVRTYRRNVLLCTPETCNRISFILKEASKIFELHGATHMQMDTFHPRFSHFDNLTTLISSLGNVMSVSCSSRMAFYQYVAQMRLDNIRRYSIGRVFQDAFNLPRELQECSFDSISPEIDGILGDAEGLQVMQKVCRNVFPTDYKIVTLINHISIIDGVLLGYKLNRRQQDALKDLLLDIRLSDYEHCTHSLRKLAREQHLNLNIIGDIVQSLFNTPLCMVKNIRELPFDTKGFSKKCKKMLKDGLVCLNAFTNKLQLFGVNSNDVFIKPMLLVDKHSSGIMFQAYVVYRDTGFELVAAGGRYDKHMLKCCINEGVDLKLSSTGVSFHIQKMVDMLLDSQTPIPVLDVIVLTDNTEASVSVLNILRDHDIKCDLVRGKKLEELSEYHRGHIKFVLSHRGTREALLTVYSIKDSRIYEAAWPDPNISSFILSFFSSSSAA